VRQQRAEIDFRGDSLEVLSSFPIAVKATFGYNLRRLQNGEDLLCNWRPMSSVGSGVVELKEQDARTWYRLMYLTQVEGVIYVLHCFEKNSAKTDRRDLEIVQKRLSEVRSEIVRNRAKSRKQEQHGKDQK
jgi:phage-related protein